MKIRVNFPLKEEMLLLWVFLASPLQKTAKNSHAYPKAQLFSSELEVSWAALKAQSELKMSKIPVSEVRRGITRTFKHADQNPLFCDAEEIPLQTGTTWVLLLPLISATASHQVKQ